MLAIVAVALLALDFALQEAAADAEVRLGGRVVSTYPAGAATAVVTLQRIDRPDTGLRTTTTDANGRFSFDRVPEGHYVATVEKHGYTSRRWHVTEPRLEAGVEVRLRRGQPEADVEIRLWRAASLTGRVIRSDGAAAPGIHVALAQRHSDRLVILPGTQVTTTWDGHYAMASLPPGEYLVMATGVGHTSSSGSLPTASAEQAAFEINATRPEDFTPTLYPGVPSTDPGAAVTLREGLATTGVDLWLAPARRFSISGRVTWPETETVGDITLEYGSPSDRRASIWTVSDPGGLFTIDAVAPGTVVLMASANSKGRRLMGLVSTDVRAGDVEDVTLTLVPPGRLEGRVVFPSELAPSARPNTIALVPRLLNVSPLYTAPEAPIAPDGTFSLSNTLGEYEFALPGLRDGLRIASVSRNGQVLPANRIGVAAEEIVDRIVVTVSGGE
jgi:hypothetical protein